MSEQDCELVMGSIADNNYFLQFNRDPCDEMIEFLKTKFDPDTVDGNYSLSIGYGSGGARLSHNHKTQYYFVMQTLMLWRDILHDFYRLWFLAEDDLLNPNNGYRLRNTGQGLNRIQSSPNIAREMSRIIHTARTKVGYWIGSSVVHLGDHNVPNAFMFIDKYTQVKNEKLKLMKWQKSCMSVCNVTFFFFLSLIFYAFTSYNLKNATVFSSFD